MTHVLHISQDITCPSEAFIFLYLKVSPLDPEVRSLALPQPIDFKIQLRKILLEESPQDIVDYIRLLLKKPTPKHEVFIGKILAIMSEIDSLFYSIHPRSFNIPVAIGGGWKIPSWLESLKMKRRVVGSYAEYNDYILFPRGPLSRSARGADAASADSMADRFSALAISPTLFRQEDRPIHIRLKVIGAGKVGGIAPTKKIGSETIGFIPVAEKSNDIECQQRDFSGRRFVSFTPAASIDPVSITFNALGNSSSVDIGILPELMIPARLVSKLSSEIIKLASLAPRLLVCGSGDTEETNHLGMRWNQASVLNSAGRVMWEQRKIWPAGFSESRAIEYGLISSPGSLVMEDNAASNELQIVDIDTLGRCIILICQDVLADDVSTQSIIRFQPDWVFTPILDSGIAPNRWINTRLYELSGLSPSRYLVSTSLAFAEKFGYSGAGCGLAMGPRSGTKDDKAKQYVIVKATNGIAIATWRQGDWGESKLS